MNPTGAKLFLAFALFAAPAALGVGALTDTFDDEATPTQAHAVDGAAQAQAVETFEGSVPDEVANAELDLRIDRGPIHVKAWDKDTYKIEVLAEQNASGDNLETEFDESVDGDTIALSLVVDHKPTAGVDVTVDGAPGQDAGERAVVAHVPAELAYQHVFACEGEQTESATDPIVSQGEDGCVQSDQASLASASVHLQGEDGLDVHWGLEGLSGDTFEVRADNGDVELAELDATLVDVETENGNVAASQVVADEVRVASANGALDLALDADNATATTDNGEIEVSGAVDELRADSENGAVSVASSTLSQGDVSTQNGDITMDVEPARSGELTVATDNGAIDVQLAHADDVGYDASGTSDNGEVAIALVDETSSEEETADDEHDSGDEESAHTSGYGQLPIQLAIDATSDNGSIEIVEETADTSEDQESEEESSSASLATLS